LLTPSTAPGGFSINVLNSDFPIAYSVSAAPARQQKTPLPARLESGGVSGFF